MRCMRRSHTSFCSSKLPYRQEVDSVDVSRIPLNYNDDDDDEY